MSQAPRAKAAPNLLACNLGLKVAGRRHDFGEQLISKNGLFHIPIPKEGFEGAPGTRIEAEISVPKGPSGKLVFHARLVREFAPAHEYIGLSFDWRGQEKAQQELLTWIARWGHSTEPSRREHTRLEARAANPAFPLQAKVHQSNDSAFQPAQPEHPVWYARIKELSIGGLQLSSDSADAVAIRPGDGLQMRLEARESAGFEIECLGHVRWIMIQADPATETLIRYFGIRFEWIDESQKALYFALLKSILDHSRKP